MKNDYRELLTDFSDGEREGIVTKTLTKVAGKISVTERKGRGSLAYDLQLEESLLFNDRLQSGAARIFGDLLYRLLRQNGFSAAKKALVVGLGNEGMVADSLGARVLNHLDITGHLKQREEQKGILSALKSSVSGVTGLESYDVIKGLTDRIHPDVIIAVDTLACVDPDRLGTVIQLSDAGISPGSGVGNAKQRLDTDSVGCPVIAVGVPFVIYLKNILKKIMKEDNTLQLERALSKDLSDMVVTLKEIDVLVETFSAVIGNGINRAVHFLSVR